MVTKEKKLEVLYKFSLVVIKNPLLSYLMGFLAGQVDRVHFVNDLTGAEISLQLCVRSLALWPTEPFRATTGGISMPNPISFVQAVSKSRSQICVRLDFDNAENAEWYQEVLLPNVSYVKNAAEAAEEEIFKLKQEMNRSLDIYRECKNMLNDSVPDKQEEIKFYIKLAEQQLKKLSYRLETLNTKIKQLTGP